MLTKTQLLGLIASIAVITVALLSISDEFDYFRSFGVILGIIAILLALLMILYQLMLNPSKKIQGSYSDWREDYQARKWLREIPELEQNLKTVCMDTSGTAVSLMALKILIERHFKDKEKPQRVVTTLETISNQIIVLGKRHNCFHDLIYYGPKRSARGALRITLRHLLGLTKAYHAQATQLRELLETTFPEELPRELRDAHDKLVFEFNRRVAGIYAFDDKIHKAQADFQPKIRPVLLALSPNEEIKRAYEVAKKILPLVEQLWKQTTMSSDDTLFSVVERLTKEQPKAEVVVWRTYFRHYRNYLKDEVQTLKANLEDQIKAPTEVEKTIENFKTTFSHYYKAHQEFLTLLENLDSGNFESIERYKSAFNELIHGLHATERELELFTGGPIFKDTPMWDFWPDR